MLECRTRPRRDSIRTHLDLYEEYADAEKLGGADFRRAGKTSAKIDVDRGHGIKIMAHTSYIFGAGASYACSSKTPLITQFFSEAKARGGLCEKIRADLTESLNKSLAL